MAKINTNTALDVANKMSLSVSSSSNSKNYYEELYSWAPQLSFNDIFAEIVPTAANVSEADTNVTNNPTILEKITDYQMDEIPSVNGQAFAIYSTPGDTSSERLKHFILPQKYGNGYSFSLKDGNNNVINLTDGAYQFDYNNGILRFDDAHRPSDMGWTLPLKITAYRYIGTMLNGSSGGCDGYEEKLNITSDGQTTFTLSETPSDTGALFLNGVFYPEGIGYTISGTTLTWLKPNGIVLETTDELIFKYCVAIGVGTTPDDGYIATNTVYVASDKDEISDKRFKTFADARSYVLSQSPSKANRWTIYIEKMENEDIVVDEWVKITGNKQSSVLNNVKVSNSNISSKDESVNGDNALIENLPLTSVLLDSGRYLKIDNCNIIGKAAPYMHSDVKGDIEIYNSYVYYFNANDSNASVEFNNCVIGTISTNNNTVVKNSIINNYMDWGNQSIFGWSGGYFYNTKIITVTDGLHNWSAGDYYFYNNCDIELIPDTSESGIFNLYIYDSKISGNYGDIGGASYNLRMYIHNSYANFNLTGKSGSTIIKMYDTLFDGNLTIYGFLATRGVVFGNSGSITTVPGTYDWNDIQGSRFSNVGTTLNATDTVAAVKELDSRIYNRDYVTINSSFTGLEDPSKGEFSNLNSFFTYINGKRLLKPLEIKMANEKQTYTSNIIIDHPDSHLMTIKGNIKRYGDAIQNIEINSYSNNIYNVNIKLVNPHASSYSVGDIIGISGFAMSSQSENDATLNGTWEVVSVDSSNNIIVCEGSRQGKTTLSGVISKDGTMSSNHNIIEISGNISFIVKTPINIENITIKADMNNPPEYIMIINKDSSFYDDANRENYVRFKNLAILHALSGNDVVEGIIYAKNSKIVFEIDNGMDFRNSFMVSGASGDIIYAENSILEIARMAITGGNGGIFLKNSRLIIGNQISSVAGIGNQSAIRLIQNSYMSGEYIDVTNGNSIGILVDDSSKFYGDYIYVSGFGQSGYDINNNSTIIVHNGFSKDNGGYGLNINNHSYGFLQNVTFYNNISGDSNITISTIDSTGAFWRS